MISPCSCRNICLVLLGRLTRAIGTPVGSYALIADAGSTGTRMYLFHAVEDATGAERIDITSVGKGPALSSFVDHPTDAAWAVRDQIHKAMVMIPQGMHSSVPVSVLATAGMRLVKQATATRIYDNLKRRLLDESFPFDNRSFQVRTISGREEGVFAFVAANYLAHRIGSDLKVLSENLMGVLDLGGSSTQIAVPPPVKVGEHLVAKLGERHMYARSFLSFGMERMRQLTYRHIVDHSHWSQRAKSAASNPCAFSGLDDEEFFYWRGTGDAVRCEEAVVDVLKSEATDCKIRGHHTHNSLDCLPMSLVESAQPVVLSGVPRFFLISGYVFVTDFARWWLEHPGALPAKAGVGQDAAETLRRLADRATYASPSISDLRAAAALLCSESWENISAAANGSSGGHSMTPSHKVPHRCFELNYIIALLSLGYGFDESARPFQIVDKLEGSDLEWSLGAFLLSRHSGQMQAIDSNRGTDDGILESKVDETSRERLLVIFCAIMMAATALIILGRRWKASCLDNFLPGQIEKIA